MVITYHLDEAELDEKFYQNLKTQFKNKKLSITVAEEPDATEYLLANPANAERLLKSIQNINNRNETVRVDVNQLKQMVAQ